MKTNKTVVVLVAVLFGMVAGGMLEHVRRAPPKKPGKTASGAQAERPAAQEVADKRDLMSLRSANDALREANERLRRRLAETEITLAENDGERNGTAAVTNAPSETPAEERRPQREGFAERMERMRRENPEEYAEMQRRRAEFRQQMEQLARDRDDFLAAVDVKNMNQTQRANHDKLLETVAYVNALFKEMESAQGERRRELWREMAEAGAALETLYAEERRYLFEETARSMGYQGEDAGAFAEHMQSIIDNTSAMPSFRRGGRGTGRPR
jgi:hypothetical protein